MMALERLMLHSIQSGVALAYSVLKIASMALVGVAP
jgi:hypothetical protein